MATRLLWEQEVEGSIPSVPTHKVFGENRYAGTMNMLTTIMIAVGSLALLGWLGELVAKIFKS